MVSPHNTVIGFVGTGVMGKSMAMRLRQAGYKLIVHTRTQEKSQPLIETGATWAESLPELASEADVVITMVGYPHDVESVYFGENGVLRYLEKGTYVIDMTTSSPILAEKICEESARRGIHALDAPVSGGDIGARDGKLSIMVGGAEEDFSAVKPIFEVLGENIVLQGPCGAGQHTKMCNQIAIASNMLGVCEAIAYAQHAGLNPERVLKSISSGAAGSWSLSNLAPRMMKGDVEPGFYVKHFIKDMSIALDVAKEMGLKTPGLELSKGLYEDLAKQGYESKGTQALYKLYE